MVSPLPFMGPVGAVRIGRVDGELVINPTLPDVETSRARSTSIVVGTQGRADDGRGRRRRGARGRRCSRRFELAHGEIVKICEAQEDLRRQVGKDEVARPGADRGARA